MDAAQGVEAQTLANVYLALDHDLDVMPVINKIDLPSAEPERVIEEIEDVIGIEAQDAPRISAKIGSKKFWSKSWRRYQRQLEMQKLRFRHLFLTPYMILTKESSYSAESKKVQ